MQARRRTAEPMPRNNPRGPSFCKMTLTPWKTPLYFLTVSDFACSSPCSCNLQSWHQPPGDLARVTARAKYRIFTVSKLWVTVTAPHAAMPPATKALGSDSDHVSKTGPASSPCSTRSGASHIPGRGGHLCEIASVCGDGAAAVYFWAVWNKDQRLCTDDQKKRKTVKEWRGC